MEKREPFYCWWECKLVQPLWRTVWRFLKNLEIEPPYDPAIPLLGINIEKKQPRHSSANEWIRKLWYIYTMEYYLAIKKEHV